MGWAPSTVSASSWERGEGGQPDGSAREQIALGTRDSKWGSAPSAPLDGTRRLQQQRPPQRITIRQRLRTLTLLSKHHSYRPEPYQCSDRNGRWASGGMRPLAGRLSAALLMTNAGHALSRGASVIATFRTMCRLRISPQCTHLGARCDESQRLTRIISAETVHACFTDACSGP